MTVPQILNPGPAPSCKSIKCTICVDEHLSDGIEPSDAITWAPVSQVVNAGGQAMVAVVALPVCLSCRKKQLGPKSGLMVA